ncbi:unnamed protein product [Vitrella brassicaformis CCMP3155]|uniref:Uncharacterized protein n=1 Tax=Vitrella brassicaformis (strain CCMP3155) TaxID=1169540 RepID=A0A0G4FH07_VITBC|nr:unnamed protein product [Vitrella brassicaformis CCMP3155]|eukprot:CEM12141.1 unnamed protein product [Vitrella brassicaformis CCMP3155]
MGNDVTVPSSRQPIPPTRVNEAIDFIHREERDAFHEQRDVGCLRCAATFLRQIDFSAAVLRNRLGRCLAAKQLDGIIAFDLQLETKLVLKAIWLVETQQWTEVTNALKLAAQKGYCQLPITVAVADLQRHDSKQLGRCELFDQPGGGVRALKDEPGFELDINPPLHPAHAYQTHAINDNPPVRSTIDRQGGSWTTDEETTDASASAFVMRVILAESPVANWGKTPWVAVDRHAHGGVLHGLLNQSPHQPPDRCTAVVASRWDDRDPPAEARILLLTPFDSPFVASITLGTFANTDTVFVSVVTTEPPVGDPSAAFKDRRPATAPLVGGPLGSTIADMVVNRQEKVADEEEGADEDEFNDIDGEGDGDGRQQQQEDEEGEGVEREAKRRRLQDS